MGYLKGQIEHSEQKLKGFEDLNNDIENWVQKIKLFIPGFTTGYTDWIHAAYGYCFSDITIKQYSRTF